MTRPAGTWQNWARTERVRPLAVEYPSTIEAVRRSGRSAAKHGRPIKAVGTGHSFTGIAVAPGTLTELTALTKSNTRLSADVPTKPLSATSRLVDDVLVGNVVHQSVCSAGRAAPGLVPGINRLSARVWGDRTFSDASHRVFATSRGVRFREMEYAVPLENLASAFRGVQRVIDENGWHVEFPIEVRVAAADDLWLSTATGRATGYLAVHRYWKVDPTAYFAAVEEVMLAHGGRPHWGKMHTLDATALRARYPRFDDFTALRDRLDPHRAFRNPYLDRVLGG